MIAVVDYGAGNLRSIRRALEAAGAEVVVSSDPEQVAAADAAMDCLDQLDMIRPMRESVAAGKPFLGICLGMQLLFEAQEEGDTTGLGVLRGRVRAIAGPVKVPHMGWNRSRVVRDGPLGPAGEERDYYFVHSYVVEPEDPEDVAAVFAYGGEHPSVVVRANVWGTQFHPEKSGDDGLALVRAFAARVPAAVGSGR